MFDKIIKGLENKYFILVIFATCFISWLFKSILAVALIITISGSAILILCKDIRNFLASILYVPFFLVNLAEEDHWTLYLICIVILVFCLIYNLVYKMLIKRRGNITKGKMFWPFIVAIVAIMFGGIFTNYNFVASLIIAGIFFACYIFYFISINSGKDLAEYVDFYFIVGSIFIILDIIVIYFIRRELSQDWIAAQNVNTTALCLVLGICSIAKVGYKTKYDAISLLICGVLTMFIILTRCRIGLAISIIVDIVLLVKTFISSNKKQYILISIFLILSLFVAFYFAFSDVIDSILSRFVGKSFLNGREELWPWCINAFKNHPIFGYGFIAKEEVPTVRNVVGSLILTHNTILQWLICVGLVGSIAFMYFYIEKYIVIFRSEVKGKFFYIAGIIAVAVSGIADQAATMDFFLVASVFMFVAVCELNSN